LSPRPARRLGAARLVANALLLALPSTALANPQGGVVQGGIATITGQGTSHVDVHQGSQGAVLSWERFDIGAGEKTQFHQPNASAVAINKILQQDPSKIFGALEANGNVYLINPNGFLFGASATVKTRGFVAATSADDLMKLPNGFDAGAKSAPGAKIENHGSIETGDGGFVYLVAPRLENGHDAVITTPNGEVLLAAGARVTLTDDPRGIGLGIQYTAPGEPGGEAVNLGKLVANGGFARMRAERIRQGGLVQANAVRERAGKIELYATQDLQLEAGSRTDASGGAAAGPGGEVLAKSDGGAAMHAGATIDVSGGAASGDAGRGELSAKGTLALAGTLRADAHGGGRRGSIAIDPSVLTIDGSTSFVGAGEVVAEATDRIEIAPNTTVSLANDAQAGDRTAARQTLTLRSGRHISFGLGAKIEDDGSGAGGEKVWDVNLVAGADLASQDHLATRAGSDGSLYLSGGVFNPDGSLRTLGINNGEVSLARGDLTVRAAGDVVVGNGGGLRDQRGEIDVVAGRDVRFRAGSASADGVIENGSGDIHVRAGGSVKLVEDPNVHGNAAIRTRGIAGTDAQGRPTTSEGGDIVIEAGGDVDAGVGNRWVEPGLNLSPAEYRASYEGIVADNPDLGLPPLGDVPDFDPLPVVSQGILGIGTEAGGDVTIVAGGSVRTGVSSQSRSGATASQLGTQYNGSHIGVFGQPVVSVVDKLDSLGYLLDPANNAPVLRPVPIADAPQGHLVVVAGDAIEGDYMVRNGTAELRAGYALASGVDARSLDAAHLDASLVESAAAQLDPHAGWFGTLARPVTVDTVEASVTGAGRNGIALRAIENPSLVYPPSASSSSGVYAVPTWRPTDSATLRSSHGDVFLVGNDINLPSASSATAQPNGLVRLLPPNLSVETDRGDLVLLNDFTVYPSTHGGVTLDVAGKVRTAGFTASSAALLSVFFETHGASGDHAFSLPAGTKLRDPETGIEYTLTSEMNVASRRPAQPSIGTVVFRVSPDAAGRSVVVPAGTRVSTSDGRIYSVLQDAILLPPSQRLSQGQVTFYATGGNAREATQIQSGTVLVGAHGERFAVSQDGTLLPGQTQITLAVRALTPGVDAGAFDLSLEAPLAGIERATNLAATARPTDISARVQAVDPGAAGNALGFQVTALVDPVRGIEAVTNKGQLSGGADLAPFGVGKIAPTNLGDDPIFRAGVLGPAGELPAGTRLVIADPGVLPAGVSADDIVIAVNQVGKNAAVTPALYRGLRDEGGALRGDPAPGTVATVGTNEIWQRDGNGTSARLVQSDAAPDLDARTVNGSFSYATYFSTCRSGVACGELGTFGDGPTHAQDPSTSWLRAVGGFERVAIDLAKPAFALTGDAGPDGIFGTADDGASGSIFDFALITQHTKATDETTIWVPIGDASFGAASPAPDVDPDLGSGLQVAGPGKASVLVGVLPNAPQVDANGNGRIDPEESAGDRDGDGRVEASEWRGSPDVFTSIDEAQREYTLGTEENLFRSRLVLPGAGDGGLTPAETPYVPSGRGGKLSLAAALPVERAQLSLGLSTIGNVRNETLPAGSAELVVAADGDVDLGGRGSIETYQGSTALVESVSGGVHGGSPPEGFTGRRGIVTLYRTAGFGDHPAEPTGGGPIGIDVETDFDIGGLALAALSGSDIAIVSRGGSIDAGQSSPFTDPSVFVDASGTVNVKYEGGGIFANAGDVSLLAKQDIRIGAGITGQNVNIDAGGSLVGGGAGGISAGNVNINVSGSISGNISASGSINVSGGSVSQGASLSAGGVVAGAGAGVGSNTSGGKVSTELSNVSERANALGSAGVQTASAAACANSAGGCGKKRGVLIQVTSRVIDEPPANP